MTRTPRALLGLAIAAAVTSGCGATLGTTSALRMQHTASSRPGQPAAEVQLAGEAAWRLRPGRIAATGSYSPTLTLAGSGSPLLRQRLGAELGSGRPAGLHPFGMLRLEYGELRPAELQDTAGEQLDALPDVPTLTVYSARAEAGWRGQVSRRSRLLLNAGLERSAGTGEAASALPELTRASLGLRLQQQAGRHQEAELAVDFARIDLLEARLLAEGEARLTRRLSPGLAVTFGGGAAAAYGPRGGADRELAVRPLAGVSLGYAPAAAAGAATQLSLLTRPEFDRLDGGLRQRLQAGGALELPLFGRTRASGRLRWARDLAGEGTRRELFSGDAGVSAQLNRQTSVEFALRVLRQGDLTGTAPAGSERRLQLRISRGTDPS